MTYREELTKLIHEMRLSYLTYNEVIQEVRTIFIRDVMQQYKGCQTKMANELGKHRNTLARNLFDLDLLNELHELKSYNRTKNIVKPLKDKKGYFVSSKELEKQELNSIYNIDIYNTEIQRAKKYKKVSENEQSSLNDTKQTI